MKNKSISFLSAVIAPLLLLLPIIFEGKALYWGTPSLQFIPWQVFEARTIITGQLPWWNPLNGVGAPLIANYQSAFFYPFTWILWLFYIFGNINWGAWANTLVLLIHLWIAAFGMRQIVKHWGFSEFPQVIAGVCFSLSGYIICRLGFFSMVYAAVWLPWIIYLIEKLFILREKKTILQTTLKLILVIALLFLAGHAQTSFYTMIFAGFWVVILGMIRYGIKKSAYVTGLLFGATFVAVLLTSIQLYPTFEYLQNSQRSTTIDYDTVVTYSFFPLKIITFLIPDLFGNPGTGNYRGYATYWEDAVYIGVIPFALVLSTLSLSLFRKSNSSPNGTNRKKVIIFLWLGILISLFFAFGKYGPVFPFFYKNVPFFDMFKAPARYLFLTVFCVVLLASIGADQVSRPTGRTLFWTRLGVAGAVAISIGATIGIFFLPNLDSALFAGTIQLSLLLTIYGLLLLYVPKENKDLSFWLITATVFVISDLLVFGSRAIPTIKANHYLSAQTENLQNGRMYISQKDEYTFKIHRFFRFADFGQIEPFRDVFTSGLPNINMVGKYPVVNNFDPLVTNEYKQWMDFLDRQPDPQLENWLKIMGVDRWRKYAPETINGYLDVPILESSKVHWYSCVKSYNTDMSLDKTFGVLNKQDILNVLYFDNLPDSKLQKCDKNLSASIKTVEESALSLEYMVTSSDQGWLFVADGYYPGWKAYVDNLETPILRSNYLFRSVYLPKGIHYVKFIYKPVWLPFLSILTILSWFVYATIWILASIKK